MQAGRQAGRHVAVYAGIPHFQKAHQLRTPAQDELPLAASPDDE